MDLHTLLRRAVELGASDLHMKAGRPPVFRVDGEIQPHDHAPLTDADADDALRLITSAATERYERFQATGDLDLAYTAEGLPRFRVNVYRTRGSIAFSFRLIPAQVPSFEQLGLPPGVQ